jgi:hypothetical protein
VLLLERADSTYTFFVLVTLLILAHHSFLRFIYYLKKEPDFLRIQNQRNSFSRRGNAASIRGTFPDFTLFSEIFVGRYGKKKNVMYLSCFIICHFVLHIKKLLLCINKFIYIFEKDR